ncbi:hypothetical protein OAV92_01440 [Crocinitomicaceae bacterium]|nr:hypothetical protein [Crocinitomicaceae bacterium]
MKLANKHINTNLKAIEENGNDGIRAKDFLPRQLREELIEYLLANDLIEREDNPDVYFLTDRGYAAIDNSEWYDRELEERSDGSHDEYEKRSLRYSVVHAENELLPEEQKKEVIKPSHNAQLLIVSAFVIIGTYLLNGKFNFLIPKKEQPELSIPLNLIFETSGDTIYLIEKENRKN